MYIKNIIKCNSVLVVLGKRYISNTIALVDYQFYLRMLLWFKNLVTTKLLGNLKCESCVMMPLPIFCINKNWTYSSFFLTSLMTLFMLNGLNKIVVLMKIFLVKQESYISWVISFRLVNIICLDYHDNVIFKVLRWHLFTSGLVILYMDNFR